METIEMLLFVSIEERILEYLKQNADEAGEVKTTHEKMAIDLGSSREVITRQLKKMADKKLLSLERGKIILN
jgi:CRP/FNR family transcriptional regulator